MSLASSLTISSTAYLFKAMRTLWLRSFEVEGRDILLEALREDRHKDQRLLGGKGKERDMDPGWAVQAAGPDPASGGVGSALGDVAGPSRRGLVTICNHNSVVDDPLVWSMLPLSNYLPFATPTHTGRTNRWTLGASDVMFTNPVFSRFFASGQVIETFRGQGVFQPAIDTAVKLLQRGEWIHIFPEGKVNQPKLNPPGGLFRFKWGVGRIIMDSKVMPEIIPMWISNFDQIMNEYRGFPRLFPRPGANVSVTIGEPITDKIRPLVDKWRSLAAREEGTVGIGGDWQPSSASAMTTEVGSQTRAQDKAIPGEHGPDGAEQRAARDQGRLAGGEEEEVRKRIVAVLQDEVRKLGERVEAKQGRFERGEWSNSRANPALAAKA